MSSPSPEATSNDAIAVLSDMPFAAARGSTSFQFVLACFEVAARRSAVSSAPNTSERARLGAGEKQGYEARKTNVATIEARFRK